MTIKRFIIEEKGVKKKLWFIFMDLDFVEEKEKGRREEARW